MRRASRNRRGGVAGDAPGLLARLVVIALFAAWLWAALQGDVVAVVVLSLGIVLVETST